MFDYDTQVLDTEELLWEEVLTSADSQWLTVQQLRAEQSKLQQYTVKKPLKKPINIRILASDLIKLKSKAEMMGIPYQTYIALELHKMVN